LAEPPSAAVGPEAERVRLAELGDVVLVFVELADVDLLRLAAVW
jgi:hypothetical protein